MNKRLLELAIQAGWDNHHSKFDTRIEKFVELTVEECEKSIKSVPTHFEAQDKIIVECLKAISEHFFGVEE